MCEHIQSTWVRCGTVLCDSIACWTSWSTCNIICAFANKCTETVCRRHFRWDFKYREVSSVCDSACVERFLPLSFDASLLLCPWSSILTIPWTYLSPFHHQLFSSSSSAAESTNSRVAWLTALESTLLISMSIVQLMWIRQWFGERDIKRPTRVWFSDDDTYSMVIWEHIFFLFLRQLFESSFYIPLSSFLFVAFCSTLESMPAFLLIEFVSEFENINPCTTCHVLVCRTKLKEHNQRVRGITSTRSKLNSKWECLTPIWNWRGLQHPFSFCLWRSRGQQPLHASSLVIGVGEPAANIEDLHSGNAEQQERLEESEVHHTRVGALGGCKDEDIQGKKKAVREFVNQMKTATDVDMQANGREHS